uniref:NADH dehydrogenase subunit 6 n=1 Tax=Acrobeloides nanus TaxID=290746 RepID=A0A914C9W0_9BILA
MGIQKYIGDALWISATILWLALLLIAIVNQHTGYEIAICIILFTCFGISYALAKCSAIFKQKILYKIAVALLLFALLTWYFYGITLIIGGILLSSYPEIPVSLFQRSTFGNVELSQGYMLALGISIVIFLTIVGTGVIFTIYRPVVPVAELRRQRAMKEAMKQANGQSRQNLLI